MCPLARLTTRALVTRARTQADDEKSTRTRTPKEADPIRGVERAVGVDLTTNVINNNNNRIGN